MTFIIKQAAWLVPVFCGCFYCATAQETVPADCRYNIHGKVIDGDHDDPLPGAGMYIKELKTGSITNLDGEYTIKGLCAGTYTVVCQFVGFESQEMKVTVTSSITLDLKLYHKPTNLETVTITAIAQQRPASLVTSTLEGEQLEALKGGTLGDALRTISGVTTIQTGPTISKPVIHGMHSQRILMLNNGVRQEGQQWGAEHAPEIDPFAAGSVSVIKGAASVRYGSDAVAGIIMVEPPELRKTPGIGGHVYGVGISNGRQGVMSIQINGKPEKYRKLSWRMQGSVKKGGDLRAPDYFLTNTGVEEANGSATVKWEHSSGNTEISASTFNTKLGIYAGAHIGNLTDLEEVIKSGKPLVDQPFRYEIKAPHQEVHHHLLSIRNRYTLQKIGKLNVQYGLQLNQRAEFDVRRGDTNQDNLPADFELDLTTHTAEISIDHRAIGPLAGTIGVSGMLQENRIDGRRFLIPDYDAFNAGLFIIERWYHNDLTLEAGGRADTRNQKVYGQRANAREMLAPVDLKFNRFSGSAGVLYAPGHHWKCQLNAGTAWRAPSINELYSNGIHHGSASFEIGDENLKAETSYALNGAMDYTSAGFDVSVQPYIQLIKNYIFAQPLPDPVLTIRGAFPAFGFTQTDALFTGIDWSSRKEFFHDYELVTTASLVIAQNISDDEPVPFIPPARISNTIIRKFKPKGKLLESSIGIGHQTVARQSRYVEASDFLAPPAGYTLLHLEASARLKTGDRDVWLQASISNALNTNYRDYLNRFRYFADETGRTFTLRVKVPFGKTEE